MSREGFIAQIAPLVQQIAPEYGIACNSAVIAQAINESGWGESELAARYHNYFGLKCGSGWTGASVNMQTKEEYRPGTHTTIRDNFRTYSSMEDGVRGYFEFIQYSRYRNLRGITDPRSYLQTIVADGYATSSSYVENCMALVEQYDLTRYDATRHDEVISTINANVAATLMEHLCEHDWHGYAQDARWGDGEGVCIVEVAALRYELLQGDRDCSSAPIECWKQALIGTPYEGALDAATNTSNMRKVFVESGLFEWKDMSFIAQRGDIYLAEGKHCAMCMSAVPDILGEFSLNELGGITGGKTGDQTGKESRIRPFYDFPWDGILHYIGGDLGSSSGKPVTAPADPRYRVFTKEHGWLPWMEGLHDTGGSGDDYAGHLGCWIYDFDWDAHEGSWFQLTLEGGEVLAKNQHNESHEKAVIGITLYYVTPEPGVTGFYVAKYRVAEPGKDYYKWELDDKDDGAGGAGPIDRLQLTLAPA